MMASGIIWGRLNFISTGVSALINNPKAPESLSARWPASPQEGLADGHAKALLGPLDKNIKNTEPAVRATRMTRRMSTV